MPDGPTLSSFGIQVFYRCESLALTRLPDGLTSIRQYAFQSSCYKIISNISPPSMAAEQAACIYSLTPSASLYGYWPSL